MSGVSPWPGIVAYGPMIGATGALAGIQGEVPQPGATDNVNFLRGDGTWAAAAGGGGASPPVTVTHAQSPYQIADVGSAVIRTFLCDTSAGILTINLPTNPVNAEIVNIKRTTSDGTALTIGRNGKNIEGAAADFADQNPGLSFYSFQYDSTSAGWWLL